MSGWGGRKVRRLTAAVVVWKGSTCHLCGMAGANSADHDPPRVELVAAGVPDPDALAYLWPSHRLCNLIRNRRKITPELREECRRKYLASRGITDRPPNPSPRFDRDRPVFPTPDDPGRVAPSFPSPAGSEKTGSGRIRPKRARP